MRAGIRPQKPQQPQRDIKIPLSGSRPASVNRPSKPAKPAPKPEPVAEPVRKKKKKKPVEAETVTAPVQTGLSTKVIKPKLSKTDLKNLESIIGDKVESIHQLLDSDQFESASAAAHKALISTFVDILPYAEDHIRTSKGQKGIYQLNSLSSMLLETMSSARALNDRGQIAQVLMIRVLQPAFTLLAQSLVREFMQLENDATGGLPEQYKARVAQVIRDTRKALADEMQKQFNEIQTQSTKLMAG